jgi:hypothetical protein
MLGGRLVIEPRKVVIGGNVSAGELAAKRTWLTGCQIAGVALPRDRLMRLLLRRRLIGHRCPPTVRWPDTAAAIKLVRVSGQSF